MGMATLLQEGRDVRTATTAAICTNVDCCAVIPDNGTFHSVCPECGSSIINTCPHCGIKLPVNVPAIRFCPTCGSALRAAERSQQGPGLLQRPTVKFALFLSLAAIGVIALYSDPVFRYWIWLAAAILLLTGRYLDTSGLYFDPQDDPDARKRWLAAACNLAGTYLLVVCMAEILLVMIVALCTGQAGRLQDFLS